MQFEFILKDDAEVQNFTETHQKIQANMDFFELVELQRSRYYAITKNHPDETEDPDEIQHQICEVSCLKNEISVQTLGLEIYYIKGRTNLKVKDTSLYFMKDYNTVTCVIYPYLENFREVTDYMFPFPVYDFVMIGSDKVTACSRQGFLTTLYKPDNESPMEENFSFQIDLNQSEKVSCIQIEPSNDNYMLVVTEMNNKAYRLIVYEIAGYSGLVTLISVGEFLFSESRTRDHVMPIKKIDVSLKESLGWHADRVIVLIESGEAAGMLVFKIDSDFKLTEMNGFENTFLGGLRGMCTKKTDQYWFLSGTKVHYLSRGFLLKQENEGASGVQEMDTHNLVRDDNSDDDVYQRQDTSSEEEIQRTRGLRGTRGRRGRTGYDYFTPTVDAPVEWDPDNYVEDDENNGFGKDEREELIKQNLEENAKKMEEINKIKEKEKREKEDEDSDEIANYMHVGDSEDEESGSAEEEQTPVDPTNPEAVF
jgi:hypothetical protein